MSFGNKRPLGGRQTLRHYESSLKGAIKNKQNATTPSQIEAAERSIALYQMLIRDWHQSNKR